MAIALDTKGPEIRTGQFTKGSPAGDPGYLLHVEKGQTVLFSSDPALASSSDGDTIYMDYQDIGSTLAAGDDSPSLFGPFSPTLSDKVSRPF